MIIKKIFDRYRTLAVTIAAVGALLIAALAVAPAASATTTTQPGYSTLTAGGCTLALVGQQCITVNGTGVHVNYVLNFHNTSPYNKCDIYANDLYTQGGVAGYYSVYLSGCWAPGYAVRWNANQNFDSGSSMCATTKDSLTNGLYNQPACETIG